MDLFFLLHLWNKEKKKHKTIGHALMVSNIMMMPATTRLTHEVKKRCRHLTNDDADLTC